MPEESENQDLQLLLPAEQELLGRVHGFQEAVVDPAFFELAALRLRNMVEKYAEEYKRDALRDADGRDNPGSESARRLRLCRDALDACQRQLGAHADSSR